MAPAATKTKRKIPNRRNGLCIFEMHRFDNASARFVKALLKESASDPNFPAPDVKLDELDAETVAKRYLEKALASDAIPDFTNIPADGVEGNFTRLGTETLLLTQTKVVKFRQTFNKIPVYGSLVSIELDERNRLLSLNSSLGKPANVNPIARISPSRALESVQKHPGSKKELACAIPQLHYYFDSEGRKRKWRLVYIIEDVPVKPSRGEEDSDPLPQSMDFLVDAHRGNVVAALPRTPRMASANETAMDGLKRSRKFSVEVNRRHRILRNNELNVETFDFDFNDPKVDPELLPGDGIRNPPDPWPPDAVSAHANTEKVAEFLRKVLRRNSFDNKGSPLISSINCVDDQDSTGKAWRNARWLGNQAVYGQKQIGLEVKSLAVRREVVTHEVFHGVTGATARLEYTGQPGALNESYSDIFGVIVNNLNKANVKEWNWLVGEGFARDGKSPFRDMEDPTRRGHPKHMPFRRIKRDNGGVHINSGIHNHAAFKMLTATGADGRAILTPREVAAVFYIALTQHLSRRSRFSDSRRAVLLAARTLFRNLPKAKRARKIRVISRAFNAVGIK